MTENLLEAGLAEAPQAGTPAAASSSGAASARPAGLPDKFWDEAKAAVRLEALIKSYLELERKLGSLGHRAVPAGPDQYKVEVRNDMLTSDAEINKRLHGAGFSNEQAQLVYDLASERMMPMIAELASIFEAESQIERLSQHFGGDDRWREVARQIDAWARSRLPPKVFEALSTTYEGVLAMYRMMDGQEPGLLRDGASQDSSVTDASLKQLMRDPRYWKHQDPVVVEQVRDGFRRLYHDKG